MKRILLILMFFVSLIFADISSLISAVKSNPSLLDNPQVQQILKAKGITKEQLLGGKNSSNEYYQNSNLKNFIDLNSSYKEFNNSKEYNLTLDKNNREINNSEENISKIIHKPLTFIPEDKLVKFIQSKQQIVKKESLKRFGEKFFYNRNVSNNKILAVPEYYQLNVGDTILVQIFGGNDKSLNLTIDNNGNIYLPVIGPLYVANLSVAEVKNLIKTKLKPTYQNSKIVVNVKVNSFIQVSLTGYVQAPGVYNLTSLSTVKDLLIAANGFGKLGSMRNVYLKRDGKVLKFIDFYQLIKDGKLVDTTLLRNGDIIYVPRAKRLVNLSGAVSTPAIYEMKKDESLQDLVKISGGLLPDASANSIKITRFVKNSSVKVFYKSLKDRFKFKNGDNVYVYKISELNHDFVKVYGNIEKPGTYELPKDKKLATLLKKLSYLKDTYYNYGVITTFDNKIFSFSIKHPGNIKLRKKDEIYIFNKYEALPLETVEINGTAVRKAGKYRWYKGTTLKDVINSAGVKENADLKKVQIITYDKEFRPHLKYVDYTKTPDYKLHPFDKINVLDYYNFKPLKPIIVLGAVNKPDFYTYADGMSLKDALTMAGWLEDKADKNYIELVRYQVVNGERKREIKKLSIKELNFKLKPYDEITVKTIPNWNKREIITIKGQVKYPGIYVIQTGDRLADVIKRAGGFTKNAYLYGSVFTRESVREMQEKRLKEMIYKLKKKVAILSASAKGAGERNMDAKNLMDAIDSVAIQAQNLKPVGRMALQIDKNLTKFENSPYNIVLENNDTLYIPSKKDSVVVMGEVLTPSAFVYTDNSALTYIKKAGGRNDLADNVYFVVHANGFTEKAQFGDWFDGDLKVKPGDAITIPIQIKTSTWYGITKDVTSILYQLAVTAASLKTVGAL